MWKKLFGELHFESVYYDECRSDLTTAIQHGAKDIITVFHKPSSPVSKRVVTFLKTQQANAQNPATEDQASGTAAPPAEQRSNFELDIQEAEPTGDQLKNIIEYLGAGKAGTVVQGATNLTDALAKVKKDAALFQRPVVVDWHQGKVVTGDNESEILKMLKSAAETK